MRIPTRPKYPIMGRSTLMSRVPTNTVGGGRDQSAIVGHAPEHRDWRPGDPAYEPIIHRTARLEAGVTVDAGMNGPTHVGARTWLMKKVHVGHDAWIGEDVEIAPNSSVGGHVWIGDRVKIGQCVGIKPGVQIGDDVVIGNNAAVVKDIPAGETWVGNPAAPIKRSGNAERPH
jgi:acyl-[acyl carrier protein]--UDP-N-acetylglucosamine O-acyltransferase